MKTPLIAQASFTILIALVLGYVTFFEWKKVGYLADPESAAAISSFNERVSNIPKEIPNWTFVSDQKNIDPSQIGNAGITNFLTRTYRNNETGEQVNYFFSTGPTHHIAVHTPAVCYPGQGSEEIDHDAITETLQDKDRKNKIGTFLHQRFKVDGNVQDIWWAFNQEGPWVGAKDARSEFYKPALYKIYLFSFAGKAKATDEPIQVRFMRDFVTVSNPVLFPKQETPKAPVDGGEKTAPATAATDKAAK